MKLRTYSAAVAALLVALVPVGLALSAPSDAPAGTVSATSVELAPIKDNTLYESATGALSNGSGKHFFAGLPSSRGPRRGLVAFDIRGNIPAGSTIDHVQLTLHMSRTNAGAETITLHRLQADWGEGSSSASRGEGGGASAAQGDATWIHRFSNTLLWNSPGGDFAPTASASTSVGSIGSYMWGTNVPMVADVQGWLDNPSTNFGWLLKDSNESSGSAKRFDSRENTTVTNRPVLLVEYTAPEPSVLRFSASAYPVAEHAGEAVVTVTRSGGTDGEVSVPYEASDGSAEVASDYLPAGGVLVFADGEGGEVTFPVPIVDDPLVEGDETVSLSLGQPTGNAVLGSPSTAVLVIEANDAAVDVDLDGFVDIGDVLILVANFGLPPFDDPRADVNGDDRTDILDLVRVARNLGRPAPGPLASMKVERVFPNLSFQRLTGFAQPDDDRDRLFVTEQAGRVLIFPHDHGTAQAGVFLDIRSRVTTVGNEEGLLGLAFDPDYGSNGYFYVYYTAPDSRSGVASRSTVSRFSVGGDDPDMADPQSEIVILEVDQPFTNHNGGHLAFGPDGYLYIALGDGGAGGDPRGNGQDRTTLLGSILRIDVWGVSAEESYQVPDDNPFVGVSGARDEIWAYGLRNPWRFSFDALMGTLWAADVGQNRLEEVDVVQAGMNYGWKVMEGSDCFSVDPCNQPGLVLPVAEYDHTEGCSVTGGYVFRGRGMPSLMGAYVYGDYCSGKIWGLRYDGHVVTEQMLLIDPPIGSELSITSFGEDQARNLYILSRNDGLYRLVPNE